MKASVEMNGLAMNFGVRFSYDRGQCTGRCFPHNQCTCTEDCDAQYDKYGYVVGCNNFHDRYPFPEVPTQLPNGIWYSFPLDGRCEHPTGAHTCTWSWEHAGMVELTELEAVTPGGGQCCNGHCTDFWADLLSPSRSSMRARQALDLFHRKYPGMPRDDGAQWCDFRTESWYDKDTWWRRDPWHKTTGCLA
eukprot:CAMPEP_0198570146 /NCGR_PEP_ID=MMETSP1462-20131121/108721_1 /TAXON_ID=1333877 /ORGANISM="Brandtodinium nutriculum, Strain RCC3387" /LENGTH=190 /DNA_ID=CAMNT_0044301259 /DNA_START=20 /DNA_END=592 /DNA_ORIENTATION=-